MLMYAARPAMLLGLPNSGTDWFVDQICKTHESFRYFREFFNPITNEQHGESLAIAFGCEYPSTVPNIAKKCDWQTYSNILDATWRRCKYNFTKENYSAFQIENHCRVFDCFFLNRELEYCLPSIARRTYVKNWYDAMWHSLILNLHSLDEDLQRAMQFAIENADTFNKRHSTAHILYSHKTKKAAITHHIPVIEYDILADKKEADVAEHLKRFSRLNRVEALAKSIVESRKERHSYFGQLNCTDYVAELRKLVPKL